MEIGRYRRQVDEGFGAQGPRASSPAIFAGLGREVAGISERLFASLTDAEEKLEASRNQLLGSQITTGLKATLAEAHEAITDQEGAAVQSQRVAKIGQEWLSGSLKGVTDERVRNAILAHGQGVIDTWALQARVTANAKIKEGTQAGALAQLRALELQGTPDALQEAEGLIGGLTDAGILSAEAGNALLAKSKRAVEGNYFATRVKADPQGVIDELDTGTGMLAGLDAVTRDHYRGIAKQRFREDEDRAYTLRQRELQEKDRQERDEHHLRDSIAKQVHGELSVLALTDPGEAQRRAVWYAGDDYIDGGQLSAILKDIPNVYASASDQTDPAVYQQVLADFASETPQFTASTVASMRGLSLEHKRAWAGEYKRRDELADVREERAENKAERDQERAENKAERQKDQDMREVMAEVNATIDAVKSKQNPRDVERAMSLVATTIPQIFANRDAEGGVKVWWETKGRAPFEASMGRDADWSVASWEAILPPEVRKKEDLLAYAAVKGWSETHPEYRRMVRALMGRDAALANVARFKQAKELQREIRKGAQAVREGKPPGELTVDTYNEQIRWGLE